jgi:hypothetical protein
MLYRWECHITVFVFSFSGRVAILTTECVASDGARLILPAIRAVCVWLRNGHKLSIVADKFSVK